MHCSFDLAAGVVVAPAGNRSPWYLLAKRTFDIVGALALLVLFAPIMLATLVVLTFTTRGRPIFRQERLGHCGERFGMLKFRTMVLNAEVI
ncbi:MAG TPA: sugar transferase, partial [Pirellulales bacterium]|nr:sugar transferase [Pirellulales bacterium]